MNQKAEGTAPIRTLGVRLAGTARGAVSRLRRRPPDASTRAWTPLMTVLAVAAVATSVVVGIAFDSATIELVRGAGGHPVVLWLQRVTDLGESQWYLVPAALAVMAAGAADWSRRSSRGRAGLSFVAGQGAFVFAAVALSGILVNVAKFAIGRARPRLFDELGPFSFDPLGFDYIFHSYPSGHSTTIGAMALVLCVWFPRWWPVVAVAALVLGGSRVAPLAHYPSDIVAGLAFGFLSSLWLARWLAARGVGFMVPNGRLMPVMRPHRIWRSAPRFE